MCCMAKDIKIAAYALYLRFSPPLSSLSYPYPLLLPIYGSGCNGLGEWAFGVGFEGARVVWVLCTVCQLGSGTLTFSLQVCCDAEAAMADMKFFEELQRAISKLMDLLETAAPRLFS